eukprot:526431_1
MVQNVLTITTTIITITSNECANNTNTNRKFSKNNALIKQHAHGHPMTVPLSKIAEQNRQLLATGLDPAEFRRVQQKPKKNQTNVMNFIANNNISYQMFQMIWLMKI